MILHLICPDQKGIIARFTSKLYEFGINILSTEQHTEATLSDEGGTSFFYMWIRADTTGLTISQSALTEVLEALARQMQGEVHIFPSRQSRLALMGTRDAACLYDLLIKRESGNLDCDIPLIISNRTDLKSLAERFDVEFVHLPFEPTHRDAHDDALEALLAERGIDLVVLARYMQIISPRIIQAMHGNIINIHHSFLPAFKGAKPYHRAYESGVKVIGATAHYVTEVLDEGPIIAQAVVPVSHHYSVREMIRAGSEIEKQVLTRAVKAHLEHRIVLNGKRTIVFQNH